jgi:excisionase family DNA binding protein
MTPTTPTTAPETTLSIQPLALRAGEAAKALGIGERKLWEWTNRKLIPHVRIDGCRCVLYPVDLLREWLAEQAKRGRP